MAAKKLPDRILVLVRKLASSLPFLKARLPGLKTVPEPFDSIEDSATSVEDVFEPNAATDFTAKGGRRSAMGKAQGGVAHAAAERGAGFRSFLDALLGSRLAVSLLVLALLLVLTFVVVAFAVSSPPKIDAGAGRPSAEGSALMRSLLLPPSASLEARIYMERESGRVYTEADAAPYLTDTGRIDITDLEARSRAAIEAIYGAVP
jgi:hypothetical protein